LEALNSVSEAPLSTANLWKAYHSLPFIEASIGAVNTAAIVATTLWDCILDADPGLFESVLELFYRAGGERCSVAFRQFLTARRSYVPSYWHFVLFAKCLPVIGQFNTAAAVAKSLQDTGRGDLAPLFAVYAMQMRQAPVLEIATAALALADSGQRAKVADYMAETCYLPDELPVIVAAFGQLVGETAIAKAALSLMQTRLANAEGRWRDALDLIATAGAHPRYRHGADLLRAQALTGQKETRTAITLLDGMLDDRKLPRFLHARATFLRLTAEVVDRGLPVPEQKPPRPFPDTPGRPLAQSLWVGRKLRWIERLAIKSYLDNGWRFQLYVYEEPDNVPEGCEVLDASVIIPEKEVFREGMNSGPHAGSIGAFSDLFRYHLLHKRGGMWTDTDVINFKRFDPDGQRFICTEISDAAFVTLNGAIMAAPAGDPFVARASERARELLSDSNEMFFTRIGPYLLAELVLEIGVDKIELMPPSFLSPVSWINAASLLQPFDVIMARPDIREAINLHVYTETWRTVGLGLDRPPHPTSFLGRLYFDRFGEEEPPQRAAIA
jgi:hypothetical protein